MDQHAGEIQQVLDRVHGEARPGPRIDVVVVELCTVR